MLRRPALNRKAGREWPDRRLTGVPGPMLEPGRRRGIGPGGKPKEKSDANPFSPGLSLAPDQAIDPAAALGQGAARGCTPLPAALGIYHPPGKKP